METNVFLFADDTSLLEYITDPIQSFDKINRDLNRLHLWASQWLLTFNPTKTEYIVFSKKLIKEQYPSLYLGTEKVQEVIKHKQLGVTFNNQMNFKDQIQDCCTKAMKRITALKRIQNKLARQSKLQIYCTFIHPILEYGWQLYDNSPQNILSKLEKAQREALLVVTRAYKKTSHNELLKEVGIQLLSVRRKMLKCQFTFKHTKGLLPCYLSNIMPQNVGEEKPYSLRNSENLVMPLSKKNYYLKSFIPSAVKVWNELSLNVRQMNGLNDFKKKLKKVYVSDTNSMYMFKDSTSAINLSRIRMGLSGLNSHRKKYHFIDDSKCPNCACKTETPIHFFLFCPKNAALTLQLIQDICTAAPTRIEPYLNYATNKKSAEKILSVILLGVGNIEIDKAIFQACYTYIDASMRFV